MVVTLMVVPWFVVVVRIERAPKVKGLPFRRGVGEDMWWYL